MINHPDVAKLDSTNILSAVRSSQKPIVVCYVNTTCALCRELAPIYLNLVNKYKQWANFAYVVVPKSDRGIMLSMGLKESYPVTVMYFRGQELVKHLGYSYLQYVESTILRGFDIAKVQDRSLDIPNKP